MKSLDGNIDTMGPDEYSNAYVCVLAHDRSNSSVLAMELPQFCTSPSMRKWTESKLI